MSWLRLGVRRLRDGRLVSAGVFALVLVTALLAAVAPRLERSVADETLRSVVDTSAADTRGLQLRQEGSIGAAEGSDSLALVTRTQQTLESQLAPSIRSIAGDRYVVIESPRLTPARGSGREGTVRLRIQPGVESHLRYVSGRAPAAATREAGGAAGDAAGGAASVPKDIFEVGLAADSAAVLRLGVGDSLALTADRTDSIAGQFPFSLDLRVTGIYVPIDRAEPYWLADRSLHGPVERSLSPLTQIDDVTALAGPAEYAELLRTVVGSTGGVPDTGAAPGSGPGLQTKLGALRYTWRYVVDPGRLDAGSLDELAADLARLDTIFPTSGSEPAGGASAVVLTGLARVIADFHATWRSVDAILTMVGVGAGAMAALALGLATLVVAARRRRTVALWRGRGSTRLQLAVAALVEAFVLAGIPALIAVAAAPSIVPLAGIAPAPLLVAVVALFVGAVFVATGAPAEPSAGGAHARTAPGVTSRRGRGRRRAANPAATGARRLVFEGLLVAAAIAGAYLLRDRGVAALAAGPDGASAGTLAAPAGGADPLIAAVPPLVGIAAGIVAIRLFPLLVRAGSAAATRGRGLVAPLALRRIARGGASNQVMLALLAIAAFGAFASAGLAELNRTASTAAWQDVGASFRLSSGEGTIPPVLHASSLPGVTAAAAVTRINASIMRTGVPVTVLAVDAADYERVTAGTLGDPRLPADLLAGPPSTGAGSSTVVPAVISGAIAPSGPVLKAGDTGSINIMGTPVTVRAVEIRDAFPTIGGGQFVVVNRSILAATLRSSLQPTEVLLRVPAADAGAEASARIASQLVKAAEATGATDIRLVSRAAEEAQLGSSPYLLTVQRGIGAAVIVAALYAALAVAAALVLGGAARTGELAQLRALGLSRRQSLGLAVAEHAPIVALAFAFGAAAGIALFSFLEPGLGLPAIATTTAAAGSFSAARLEASLSGGVPLDVAWLGLVLAELVAILATGIAAQTLVNSRAAPAAAIRRGTE